MEHDDRELRSPLPPWALPAEFSAAPLPAEAAGACPVVEELPAALTPWEVFERLQGLAHVLFLDSAMPHATLGRYSFLTADPFEWIESRGHAVAVNGTPQTGDPFAVLAGRLARYRSAPVPGLPPFQGGAAGLFGYDLCHHLERLPRPACDEFRVPDMAVGLYDWVITFDHAAGRSWLVSTGFTETDPRRRQRRAADRLREVQTRLRRRPAETPRRGEAGPEISPSYRVPVPGRPGLFSNFGRDEYLRAIRRVIEYIYAGDCFQVNLSQRLLVAAERPAVEIYRRLRERNAATFAGYLDAGEYAVASASPERFVRVQDGEVETRPIKGTRPRGATPEEDRHRVEELITSAKDRAENIMIVDLLRNDLGRVCRYGSVRVPAVCRVETYRYVHHLVSEVRGHLRPGMTAVDLLQAAFPGGSVTGAPKIRAMEIIAELEPTARGAYCGSLGYLGFDGGADTNILIRTFTVGRGWVQFPVGGGVVADSAPEREYEETWHKAEGLLQALR